MRSNPFECAIFASYFMVKREVLRAGLIAP